MQEGRGPGARREVLPRGDGEPRAVPKQGAGTQIGVPG